jgi:hypothetical protein
MKRALRMKGPISVMFSLQPEFFSYRSGVYSAPTNCYKTGTNHALLVIGFGTDENGVDYWLVQNSWGNLWGIEGFAKIARGQNVCGMATCPTFPGNITDPWKDKSRGFSLRQHDVNTTGARCLDGSPAGLYYSKGYGDGANKTIVFFEGGGWCQGYDSQGIINDCYDRSDSNLGSTNPNVTDAYPDINPWMDQFFSARSQMDINFYNWNRFAFIYCDGTGH